MTRAFTLLAALLLLGLTPEPVRSDIQSIAPLDPAVAQLVERQAGRSGAGVAGSIPARGVTGGVVGTAIYSASATWCAPRGDQCTDWGGNARLAAVNSFRFGDEPYSVRVWRDDIYVDVTVVSFCQCQGTLHAIDLSPAAFEMLAPLSRGRIDVVVEVLVDLPPDPRDDRMRDEVRDLPATDADEESL